MRRQIILKLVSLNFSTSHSKLFSCCSMLCRLNSSKSTCCRDRLIKTLKHRLLQHLDLPQYRSDVGEDSIFWRREFRIKPSRSESSFDLKDEMKTYRYSLLDNCEKFYSRKRYPPYMGYDHMVYEPKSGFFWCAVQKAASSSWFLNLHILGGGSFDEAKISKLSPNKYSLTSPYVIRNTSKLRSFPYNESRTSFLIQRHPYHRIIATYLQNIKGFLDWSLKKKVCGRHQQQNPHKPLCSSFTFSQFVDHVISDARDNIQLGMDPNWAPISSICPVCRKDIRWDYILNFDELDKAQHYMIEQVYFYNFG